MAGIASQLPALVGVLVGAGASYLTTAATERARWKRQADTRWDERRAAVYADFGHSVIRCVTLARRIAADRGLRGYPHPLTVEEGRLELTMARAEQGVCWESVLLLGASEAIQAGRLWHRTAWQLERIALGEVDGHLEAVLAEAGHHRRAFYEAAREDLGVAGMLPEVGEAGL
ncbi:hypothetical protein ACFOY4_01805 [Actinomadura syzygii]|uniref:Secreted protein n=1 Tax=Actinomadura syzygii TaxID=1427538 RepID=A0A5D0TUK7_9ACTN|nr:hypothetical protein [Actinomadura syzygii]TYC08529.1 hypothetical protein FXF65_37150 [Actinomadura syzygii]